MIKEEFEPAYLLLARSGEMQERVTTAFQHLVKCDLCAWECQVNRQAGSLGVCRSGVKGGLSSYGPHLGEEEYHPAFNVSQYPNQFPKLRRLITSQEYQAVLQMAQDAGLQRFDERRSFPRL